MQLVIVAFVLSLRRLYALDTPEPPRCSVVVIHAGAQRFGVLVDALLGTGPGFTSRCSRKLCSADPELLAARLLAGSQLTTGRWRSGAAGCGLRGAVAWT